jgi:Tfp pilus assembly protein PilN
MSTATVARTATRFPVVNLLPPEIGDARRLRKVKAGLGVGVLAAVGVVAALFLAASSDAASAQDDLDANKAEGARLQQQTLQYANVPAVIAKVDAAKAQRDAAMAPEVRWSFYLNDLSLQIPASVWLTSVAVTQNVEGQAAPATPADAATYQTPGIGVINFEGLAYGHTDVAKWLEMLARQKGFTQPYFTNSAEDDSLVASDGSKAVKFTSSVTVTEDALSRRFEQKAGS